MTGLNDSLTMGILLVLIFGAVAFYLYSRINQNEKRVSLLENLLLTLKLNTEASLGGPESIEAISTAMPLGMDDVDQVNEEDYADMLKEIPIAQKQEVNDVKEEDHATTLENDGAELLRSMEMNDHVSSQSSRPFIDANYEAMSVKELQSLARQRNITGVPQRKRELIDALRKQGGQPPIAPTPLDKQEGELDSAMNNESTQAYTIENI